MKSLTAIIFGIAQLQPVRQWLESLEICNSKVTILLGNIIPAHCFFEREIQFFNRTNFYIPTLCQLNPLSQQLVGLRFKSLVYLVDESGEEITLYC